MTYDKNRPVSSIKHDDKRAAIPDSAHQGEEQMAISVQPEVSENHVFRHNNCEIYHHNHTPIML